MILMNVRVMMVKTCLSCKLHLYALSTLRLLPSCKYYISKMSKCLDGTGLNIKMSLINTDKVIYTNTVVFDQRFVDNIVK